MALVTLQTIFQDAFPAYEQRHALPAHVRRAAHALMPCRTAALGGHIQACPDGHGARVWDNSCRQRSCPQEEDGAIRLGPDQVEEPRDGGDQEAQGARGEENGEPPPGPAWSPDACQPVPHPRPR